MFKLKILGVIFAATVTAAYGQTAGKTVTNADLEKFRQKRLAAERDYRENYARMGFPSPEELDAQIEKSRVQREAMAERYRNERLQREQLEARPQIYYQQVQTPNYNYRGDERVIFPGFYFPYYWNNWGNRPYVRPPDRPRPSRPAARWLPQ